MDSPKRQHATWGGVDPMQRLDVFEIINSVEYRLKVNAERSNCASDLWQFECG